MSGQFHADKQMQPRILQNAACRLSVLPEECKIRIVDFLPGIDVASLRLTSKTWDRVCIAGLFNAMDGHFIESGVLCFRPHLDDMKRAMEISNNPDLANRIKHVKIYLGDFAMIFFRKALQGMDDRHLDKAEEVIRQVYHYDETHCDFTILSGIFSKLPNVDSLSLLSRECPFPIKEGFLQDAWSKMWHSAGDVELRSCLKYWETRKQYENILVAASRNLKSSIKYLALDSMPVELFLRYGLSRQQLIAETEEDTENQVLVEKQIQADLKRLVADIQELRIGIFGDLRQKRYHEIRDFALIINQFITSMRDLNTLNLAWDFDLQDAPQFRTQFQKLFYQITWPKLHSLQLQTFESSDKLLLSFIRNHASTLKNLSLDRCLLRSEGTAIGGDGGNGLVATTVREMVTNFKETLQLQKFQIMFYFLDIKIYDEDWMPIPGRQNSDVNWKEKIGKPPQNAKLLEMYVQRKCTWPMLTSDPPPLSAWIRHEQWQNILSEEDIANGVERVGSWHDPDGEEHFCLSGHLEETE